MRQLTRDLDETADPAAIKAYYTSMLPGWTEMELADDFYRQSWSFAFVSPDGRHVFAVIALTPQATDYAGKVPMSVLTNLTADHPPDVGQQKYSLPISDRKKLILHKI
ncbi:hypothetical protein N8D56_18775 [Devosia sp. A8/3-2]|nr:hypothetical protein N8D56_18775 [Devosia sp. A8/3-2]